MSKSRASKSLYNILYTYADNRNIDKEDDDDLVSVMVSKEIDTDQGLSICGDDEEFYNEILDEFVKTYKDSPAKLKELLNNSKMKEADKYLLDFSGIAANIGSNNISSIALDLKSAITTPKDGRYIQLYKDYVKSLRTLLSDIKRYKSM